jgi:hypothetical protein
MKKTTCEECRFGSLKHRKLKDGVDRKGRQRFKMLTNYHCSYQKVTHGTDQTGCKDYLGHLTMFEYLMETQPDEVNKLLSVMDLRVVHSRNKWGFDIK